MTVRSLPQRLELPVAASSETATRLLAVARSERWRDPIRLGLILLAVLGAVLTVSRLLAWWELGGWPPHDAAAHWLAGVHLREGSQVYGNWTGGVQYLIFLWAPPWAVVFAIISVVPLEMYAAAVFVASVASLRYVAGSWVASGILAIHPIIFDNLAIGNIDLLIAAVVLATLRGLAPAGAAAALVSFAKFSPVLALSRRTVRSALVGGIAAVAITIPWAHLWPEWLAMIGALRDSSFVVVPILPRVPFVLALMWLRRPWATAAAVGLATPALYFHSLVLFLPAARLFFAGRLARLDETARGSQLA